MKTNYLLLVWALFSSFSLGGQDHNWRMSSKNLSVREIYLSLDGEPYLSDAFPMGSEAKLVFDGVEGFKLRYGKAFPQIGMRVVEKNAFNTVVMQHENLLTDYKITGVNPIDAATLSASLKMGDPLQAGKSYVWEVVVSDGKGKGHITLKYDIQVQDQGARVVPTSHAGPTPAIEDAFIYDTNGLEIGEVVLQIDGQAYQHTDLPNLKTVQMVFTGVRGFDALHNRVYPGLAIRVTDSAGREILREKDLLGQYNQQGILSSTASTLTSSLTVGQPMEVGQVYKWEVHIWDKEWPKRTADAVLHFRVLR